MTVAPNVVIRKKESHLQGREFAFTRDLVREDLSSEYLRAYRRQAWEDNLRQPLPTTKDEAWRRTDLKNLAVSRFVVHQDGRLNSVPKKMVASLIGDKQEGQVSLTPGGAKVEVARDITAQGVVFTDLLTAERDFPQLLEKVMGRVIRTQEGKFAALAGSLAQNGILLYVPRGVQLQQPLHSILWGSGDYQAIISHVLVILEEGTAVTYVHEAASADNADGQALHAGLVEILVGENASLKFVELQSWGNTMWNFTHERAEVRQGGTLDWIFGAVGSRLTKNFSDINLVGQGSIGRMSGFYFTSRNQHFDHDTQQNHLAANTTSDLLFKGALLDDSRSIWQGMIYVAPGAMKTDGYQANRNLVLSPKSRADSIPGLEILADDVRCTHGAAVGKIDEEQIFYLLSRGIPRPEGERLIVEGFFDPIMRRIPFEGVRQRFQVEIERKMRSIEK